MHLEEGEEEAEVEVGPHLTVATRMTQGKKSCIVNDVWSSRIMKPEGMGLTRGGCRSE